MTRKTSAYARRMQRNPRDGSYNGAEWLNTIQRCRAFDEAEPIPGSWVPSTAATADNMEKLIRGSLARLIGGQVPQDDTDAFDILAHAIGVAVVRTEQTKGDKSSASTDLWAAKTALTQVKARWQRLGKWGATRPEQIALQDGVELYVGFLRSSSPAQMNEAARLRLEILKAQGWVEPTNDERKAA